MNSKTNKKYRKTASCFKEITQKGAFFIYKIKLFKP